MFRVTGLKIIGRVGIHIFCKKKNSEKNLILCILKGISPFKLHKISFFPENDLGFTSKLGKVGLVT